MVRHDGALVPGAAARRGRGHADPDRRRDRRASPGRRWARTCRAMRASVRSTRRSCASSPTCSTDPILPVARLRSLRPNGRDRRSRLSPGRADLRAHQLPRCRRSGRATTRARSPVSSNAFSHASCSITPTRHSDELPFEPRRGVDPVTLERGAVGVDGRVAAVPRGDPRPVERERVHDLGDRWSRARHRPVDAARCDRRGPTPRFENLVSPWRSVLGVSARASNSGQGA